MIGDRCLRVAHHAFILLLVVASAAVLSAQTVVDPRFVEFTPSADHNTNASDGRPLVQRYDLSVYVAGSSVVVETRDLGKPTPSGGVIRVDLPPLVLTPGVVYEARVTAIGPGGSTASSLSNGFSFPPACAPSINPTGQSVVAAGDTGSTTVTAGAGCAWTAVSHNSWITVTSGASGSGNGSVGFNVAANPNTSARPGTLTVAGKTFTVTQAAAPCTFAISSNSLSVGSGGDTGSTTVTAGAGCAWTAVSHNSWITVTSGASGSGDGSVGFSVAANPNTSARPGTLTVAGKTFTVTQAAAPCTFAISSNSLSVGSGAEPGSVGVTAGAGCAWTAASNVSWITVTSGANGSGDGSVGFNVAANPNTSARPGTLTVAGKTFTVTQAAAPCTFAISSNSLSVGSGAEPGSVGVTAGAGCAWTAASNVSWITVTSGANGSGNGSVGFNVAANPNTSARPGTLTVAGKTFTVTQAAAGCTFAISSNSLSVVAAGDTGSTTVTAGAGCAWTAASNVSWITVTSGANGSGDGSVGFSVAANPNTSARPGTLTVAGKTFTVTQAAAPCTFAISSNSLSVGSGAEPGSVGVTAGAGCAWTAASNVSWITVTSGANGSGNGSVGFSVAANPNTSARPGTLTVAGKTFTVTQAAAGCTFAISSNSLSVVAAGDTGSTTVTAGAGCAWTAASNVSWITVTSGANGSGDGSVGFSVAANPNTSARPGTLTVAGKTFTVTQAAAPCTFAISSNSLSVGSGAEPGSVGVTAGAGCAWTAASNVSWITVTSGANGSGNGSVGFSVAANPNTSARPGTLTVAGKTFTVTQNAASCTFTVSPTTMSPPSAGANGSATVTNTTGCAWTATTTYSWITITSGAQDTGSGQVNFTVAPNTAPSPRIGTLLIAGRTFAVSQAANTCTYGLTPTSRTMAAAGGTGTITVNTGGGCPWTATSNRSWISVSGTGTASGSASYTVSPNTSAAARSGSISIGTQSFTITQSAPTTNVPAAPSGLRIAITGR